MYEQHGTRLPPFPVFMVYLISACLWGTSTRCATHWRLEDGEVNIIYGEQDKILEKDPLFDILRSSAIKSSSNDNDNASSDVVMIISDGINSQQDEKGTETSRALAITVPASEKFKTASLTCGDPVNETAFDHLEGIADRFSHPPYAEPEVALLFRKNEFENVQMDVIEVNLLDAIKTKENQMILFNQVANFLRISGDTYHAIECFRKVLVISHNNADALLNLARILFNLRYTRDAIYLAERSLDQHIPEQSTWLQHYALGEFFEGNGEHERALSHFQMALDQNPAFHPALMSLKKLGKVPVQKSNNIYTICMIVALCLCFLVYLYYHLFKDPVVEEINNNSSSASGPATVSGLLKNKKPGLIKRSKSIL